MLCNRMLVQEKKVALLKHAGKKIMLIISDYQAQVITDSSHNDIKHSQKSTLTQSPTTWASSSEPNSVLPMINKIGFE